MVEKFKEIIRKYDSLLHDALTTQIDLKLSVKISLKILNDIKKLVNPSVVYVMFSGGKDSLALLDLVLKVFPRNYVKVVYIEVTGNTHKENVKYVYDVVRDFFNISRKNFIHLKKIDMDFFEAVVRWGWPGPKRRWCMNEFKRKILNDYLMRCHDTKPIAFVGTKVKDSPGRRKKFLSDGIILDKYWWNYAIRPIAHFSTYHVIKYVKQNKLPLCTLYEKLGESGNCVYCPFIVRRSYYVNLYKYYPYWIYKMALTELKVKEGSPFIISSKKVYFKHMLGDETYTKILDELSLSS